MFQGHAYEDSEFEEKFGSSRSKSVPPPRPDPPAPSMMSDAEKHGLIANLMAGVGKVLKAELAARDKEIAALRLRVAAMEAAMRGKGIPSYCGVWAPGTFTKGNICTKDGAMWIVTADETSTKPGDGESGWKLCVKSPRVHSGQAEPRR